MPSDGSLAYKPPACVYPGVCNVPRMVAVLAESASSVETDPVEAWLVEQIQYLTDEWFHRVLRPQQRSRREVKAACPWCRRLRENHLSHIRCPVCAQVRRSRNEPDEEDDD